MPEKLGNIIQRIRVDALLDQATAVRDYPPGKDRDD